MSIPLLDVFKGLPKEKLQQVVLVGVITLIGVVATGYFYVGKQIAGISNNRQQIADLKDRLRLAEEANRDAVRNEPARRELLSFVHEQRERMVAGDPFSWLVREISLLAEGHPVRIRSLRPGGSSPHGRNTRFNVYAATIELEGQYDHVGAFVRDLENKFPTSEVRSLDVSGEAGQGQPLQVTVRIALVMRPQKKDAEKDRNPVAAEGKGA
jgi:hypothetical protein